MRGVGEGRGLEDLRGQAWADTEHRRRVRAAGRGGRARMAQAPCVVLGRSPTISEAQCLHEKLQFNLANRMSWKTASLALCSQKGPGPEGWTLGAAAGAI